MVIPHSALDSSLVYQAAPPASMRYFALLYTPAERRDVLAALFVVDAEIRAAARSSSHDVAHTRLRWWRDEIDRLVHGVAQHPATRLLQERHRAPRSSLAKLHELLVATDMDLARMTYLNEREVRAYCARSAGALTQLMAEELLPNDSVDSATLTAANSIGVGIRLTEIVRDLRQDAHEGRIYVPLDELERRAIAPERLDAPELDAGAKEVLALLSRSARTSLLTALPDARTHESLRPLRVLAALHARLLKRIAACNYDVGTERIELSAFQKPWIAWREARRRHP